jgi:hypothetical protein
MNISRVRTGLIAAAIVTLSVPLSAANADSGGAGSAEASVTYANAVPGLAPAGKADNAPYLDRQGRRISDWGPGVTAQSSATQQAELGSARLGCTPVSGRDDPHYSSGDVSGHGWWKKGTCTAATAHVYNCLYEWYTDNTWRQKDCSPSKQLRPYTGSGDRTVARAQCNPSSGYISWRNHVDVDADGQVDTAEKPYNQADVICVVF